MGGRLRPAGVLAVWLIRSQWSAQAFDWGFAARAVGRHRYGTYCGRALGWAVFLRPLKPRPFMRNLVLATVTGFTAITLAGRAGDFVLPYLRCGGRLSLAVFDLPMAARLVGFTPTRVEASGVPVGPVGPKLAWVLTFGAKIVGASCLAVVAVLFSLRHFTEPVKRRLLAGAALPGTWFGGWSTRSDGALVLMLVYSLLEWVPIAARYWSLAQAFFGVVSITFVDSLILMVFLIITFVATVPVGFGLALQEGLGGQGLRQIGREAAG